MHVIGIDLDPLKIARANKKLSELNNYSGRYLYQIMDATDLSSFPDNAFSGAYICWLLEHIVPEKALQLLKEVKRVVAPHGVIVINEVEMASLTAKLSNGEYPPLTGKLNKLLIKEQSINRGNANLGDEKNMTSIMKTAGFENFTYTKRPFYVGKVVQTKQSFTNWTVDLFDSILPVVLANKEFTEVEFENLKKELDTCTDLNLYYVHMEVTNEKYVLILY